MWTLAVTVAVLWSGSTGALGRRLEDPDIELAEPTAGTDGQELQTTDGQEVQTTNAEEVQEIGPPPPTAWEQAMEARANSESYAQTVEAFKEFRKPSSSKTVYEANLKVAQTRLGKKDKLYEPYKLVHECEAIALSGYSTQDYLFLNPILRGAPMVDPSCNKADCGVVKEGVMAYIDVLQVGLYKLPKYKGKALWRGTRLPAEVKSGMKVGAQFTDPGFLSTSVSMEVASGAISGKPPTEIFKIVCADWEEEDPKPCFFQGRNIRAFTVHPSEKEILFPPGTTFNIVKKKKFKGGSKPLYFLVQA